MTKIKRSSVIKMLGYASNRNRTTQQNKFSITPYVKRFVKKYLAADTDKGLDAIMAMLVLHASKFENNRDFISLAMRIADKGKKKRPAK